MFLKGFIAIKQSFFWNYGIYVCITVKNQQIYEIYESRELFLQKGSS